MNNPYRPPDSAVASPGRGWFRGRPLLVYPIALLSALPFGAFAVLSLQDWSAIAEDLQAGGTPMWIFATALLLCALLMFAGLSLLFLRKAATWLFMLSMPLIALLMRPQSQSFIVGVLLLSFCALALGYGAWLHRRGRLH